MNIRLANLSDLESINQIYNQAVRKRYCTADLDELNIDERKIWFAAHNPETHPVFIVEQNGLVIGWLSFSKYRSGRRALKATAEISYYLHEDYLRKGVGTYLMEFAIAQAPNYNFKHLFAILLEPNKASIKLLEKFEFKAWALLPKIANIDGEWCSHVYYGRMV